MKKLIKLKWTPKLIAKIKLVGLSALILLLLGGLSASKAVSGFSWGNVERYAAQLLADKVDTPIQEDQVVGAVTGPNLPNPSCQNDLCTYVASGNFADATTSIVSIVNPFLVASSTATGTNYGVILKTDGSGSGRVDWLGATTTVDKIWLNITGPATSSFKVACGAAASPSAAPVDFIIPTTTLIATNTMGYQIENFVSSTTGVVDTKMSARIFLTPARPYLNCVVDGSLDSVGNNNQAFLNTANTFTGTYKARFSR